MDSRKRLHSFVMLFALFLYAAAARTHTEQHHISGQIYTLEDKAASEGSRMNSADRVVRQLEHSFSANQELSRTDSHCSHGFESHGNPTHLCSCTGLQFTMPDKTVVNFILSTLEFMLYPHESNLSQHIPDRDNPPPKTV